MSHTPLSSLRPLGYEVGGMFLFLAVSYNEFIYLHFKFLGTPCIFPEVRALIIFDRCQSETASLPDEIRHRSESDRLADPQVMDYVPDPAVR